MQKRWKQTTLAVITVGLVASPFSTFTSNAESIDYYSYDDDLYDKQLKEGSDAVTQALNTKSEVDIKKAIDIVFNIPAPNGYRIEDKEKMLFELVDLVNDMDAESSVVNYGLYFVEASVNRAKKTLISKDYMLAYAVVDSLPNNKIKDNYKKDLEKVMKLMEQETLENLKDADEMPNVFDWSKLPESAFEDYVDVDTGNYLPGYPLKIDDSNKVDAPNPNALPEENYTEKSIYETIGSHCYKITTKTNTDTKKSTTKKDLVTGADATFCSVLPITSNPKTNPSNPGYEYDFSRVQPAPMRTGENINGGVDRANSYFTNASIYGSNSKDAENESGLTLHYTLDKTEEEPYYYETDMMVSKEGTITYQQQKDVLFQLAIKSGGKAVEDKDRFLILLENKIVVIENNGDNIPVTIFDTILKDFKAEIKPMKAQVGTSDIETDSDTVDTEESETDK